MNPGYLALVVLLYDTGLKGLKKHIAPQQRIYSDFDTYISHVIRNIIILYIFIYIICIAVY